MNILQIIKNEIRDFEKNIQIVPGLFFNQRKLINTLYYYQLSKFETGDIDKDGFKKYFYNINKMPCRVETKEIDFDTKDIRLLTLKGGNSKKTWYMERDLKDWLRRQDFGLVLNRVFEELPKFGSVVLKIVDNKPYFVDLRNFIIQQDADFLHQASYIIETHHYNPTEFRRIAKEKKWKNIDLVLSEFINSKADYITVFERYGEVIEGDKVVYKKILVADVKPERIDLSIFEINNPHILVDEEIKVEDLPYFEFHREKIPGRWMGVGKVEEIIDPQIRINELTNLKVKASFWTTLQLFQTRDENINRNLLTETKNGEILTVTSEITKVATEERNLASYSYEEAMWLKNRDEIGLVYEVIRGERLPAGTPLGAARIAAGMMKAYYEFLQENIALQFKRFFKIKVMPIFKQYLTKEHSLRLVGEDLAVYREMLVGQKIQSRIIDLVAKVKRPPDFTEMEIIRTTISTMINMGDEEILVPPKDFYDDVDRDIEIEITDEAIDTRTRSASKQMILQAITVDPTILQNPIKRRILISIMEDAGLRYEDVFGAEPIQRPEEIAAMTMPITQRVGGGVGTPQIPVEAMPGQVEQTL